jgi:hypothetical protein
MSWYKGFAVGTGVGVADGDGEGEEAAATSAMSTIGINVAILTSGCVRGIV